MAIFEHLDLPNHIIYTCMEFTDPELKESCVSVFVLMKAVAYLSITQNQLRNGVLNVQLL